MRASSLLLAAALLLSFTSANNARAADDDYGDLDGPASGKTAKPKKQRNKQRPEVREIVKGTYAKANVGGAMYLGQFAGVVSAGTSLGLAVGQDFVDKEKSSLAWELMFFQGIHNGQHYEIQAENGCVERGACVEGDLRTYTMAATVEWSAYPSRRFGIGLRAGGGVLLSPLLMYNGGGDVDEDFYTEEVVNGTWGGNDFGYHKTPHPIVLGGPTIEYYTKLSHFSLGFDVDASYAVGFDLGLNLTGTLKYTF